MNNFEFFIYLIAFIFLFVFAVSWILLPIAIFGIKSILKRQFAFLEVSNNAILRELKSVVSLLDPDGSKAKAIESEATKAELRAMQEEARLKKAAADDKVAKDLSKAVVDAACPNCQTQIRIADLRPGVRHTCPTCKKTFKT